MASVQYRVSAISSRACADLYVEKALATSQSSLVNGVLRKHSSDEAEAARCRPSGEAKATLWFRGKWRVNSYPRAAVVPRKAPDSD